MDALPFLEPHLKGERFNGGSIPLNVLADFAVLEEMLVEVAKAKCKEATGKSRVPRGFMDGVSLKLTGVKDGSAIPVIQLMIVAPTARPSYTPARVYFEQAKLAIILAIHAAERDQPITDHLPRNLLGYFDRFGRSLEVGEAIEFVKSDNTPPAKLTQEIRRKLVLASSEDEYTEDVVLFGLVPVADQQANTFHVLLRDGSKVKAPLSKQQFDSVMEAFNNYRSGQRVRLKAHARYNRAQRIQVIESVEHLFVLDVLDVGDRLDELKQLKDGWFNGNGHQLSRSGLTWLATEFDRNYPEDLPLPHLYPTPEGRVRAEWSISSNEASFEIDLTQREGEWHLFNLNDDSDESELLTLSDHKGWATLETKLRRIDQGTKA